LLFASWCTEFSLILAHENAIKCFPIDERARESCRWDFIWIFLFLFSFISLKSFSTQSLPRYVSDPLKHPFIYEIKSKLMMMRSCRKYFPPIQKLDLMLVMFLISIHHRTQWSIVQHLIIAFVVFLWMNFPNFPHCSHDTKWNLKLLVEQLSLAEWKLMFCAMKTLRRLTAIFSIRIHLKIIISLIFIRVLCLFYKPQLSRWRKLKWKLFLTSSLIQKKRHQFFSHRIQLNTCVFLTKSRFHLKFRNSQLLIDRMRRVLQFLFHLMWKIIMKSF
jgi:hypothetical protein